jgi:hypothetical protein
MMDEPGSSLQFRVARALRCTRAPHFPKREQFQFAMAEVVREWTTISSCSQARSLSPTHAAIIAEYLIIFKPLMESFSTGRRARLRRGSAQSRDATEVLEALCQRHIPGSPPDIGRPRVVAVFEVARNKRRVLVEHVVHSKGDGGIIEPCAPTR